MTIYLNNANGLYIYYGSHKHNRHVNVTWINVFSRPSGSVVYPSINFSEPVSSYISYSEREKKKPIALILNRRCLPAWKMQDYHSTIDRGFLLTALKLLGLLMNLIIF